MKLYNEDGKMIGELYETETLPPVFTSREKMAKIFYNATSEALDLFYNEFRRGARKYSIGSEVHENFFLAQLVAESGYDLISKRENLNYSCEALKNMFSYYTKSPSEAYDDGRCIGHKASQIRIGNKVYANRYGNGSVSSGDGYTYRGGGFIQLTFKGNYQEIAETIALLDESIGDEGNIVSHIERVDVALVTAMAFWYKNRCYECDHIDCVTEKINKYTDTYEERKRLYQWIAGM